MKQTLRKLFILLTPRERLFACLLCAGAVVSAAFDVAGIASIVPFIAVVAGPGTIETNRWLNLVYTSLGFESTNSFLVLLGAAVLAALIINNLFRALFTWLQVSFAFSSEQSLSRRLLGGYLAQPYIFFLNRNTAELGRTVLSESMTVMRNVLAPCISIIEQSVSALFILALLLAADVWISLGTLAVLGGVYGLLYLAVRMRLTGWGRRRVEANRRRFRLSQEAMGSVKDLKILGRENYFLDRFAESCGAYARCASASTILARMPSFALEVLAFGAVLCIVLYSLSSRQSQSDLLPVLALFVFAARRIMPCVQRLFSDIASIRSNTASLDVVYEDFTVNAPHERAAAAHATEPLQLKHALRLRGITFCYPERAEPAINSLDIEIPAHASVAFVGSTGSGKTTLIDCIIGLLTPQAGSIIVDGIPVDENNRRAWQRNLGYVPQHIYLSDDTAARNIAFGLPAAHIDMQRVRAAARLASIDAFIESELPAGYQTVIGERGVRLSGGQRQRIGIARALYHDPDVLIFDEATSALDGITEQAVMDSISALARRKTIIMVAHRITTVRDCDMVFLMENGRITARGTCGELMVSSETFRAMSRETERQY